MFLRSFITDQFQRSPKILPARFKDPDAPHSRLAIATLSKLVVRRTSRALANSR
jgi:hypothetical protein